MSRANVRAAAMTLATVCLAIVAINELETGDTVGKIWSGVGAIVLALITIVTIVRDRTGRLGTQEGRASGEPDHH